MIAEPDMLAVPVARRFFGLFGDRAHRRGLRFGGSLDRLSDALRALRIPVTYEPMENGIPSAHAVGAFRTWGSPWTDVQERPQGSFLTIDLAQALSGVAADQVMVYDYDFDARRFEHHLLAKGQRVESWNVRESPIGEAERYLEERFRALRMRDWGVDIQDLHALRLPFAPALVMEAYFLRLDEMPSRVWRL